MNYSPSKESSRSKARACSLSYPGSFLQRMVFQESWALSRSLQAWSSESSTLPSSPLMSWTSRLCSNLRSSCLTFQLSIFPSPSPEDLLDEASCQGIAERLWNSKTNNFSWSDNLVKEVRVDQRLHDAGSLVPDHGHGPPGLLQEPLRLLLQVDVDHVEGDVLGEESEHGSLSVGTEPHVVDSHLVRVNLGSRRPPSLVRNIPRFRHVQ